MGSAALRTALIWHDEVMHDLVADKPTRITLGRDGRTTFTVPEIGLPQGFAIAEPRRGGYVLSLGARMRGTICTDGVERDVAALVAASPDGIAATPIAERDWGVIELDESGHHKLFFQFVPAEEPVRMFTRPVAVAASIGTLASAAAMTLLWSLKGVAIVEAAFRGIVIAAVALVIGGLVWSAIRKDSESIASLAFSVVLHTAVLFMTYQVYVEDNPFVWPGLRSLADRYVVTRLDPAEPPPAPRPTVAVPARPQPPRPATVKPANPPAGRDAEARPPGRLVAPKVQFLTQQNKAVLDAIAEHRVADDIGRFMALTTAPPTGRPGGGPSRDSDIATTRGDGEPGVSRVYQPSASPIDVGPMRPTSCAGPGCKGIAPRAMPRALLDVQPPSGAYDGLTEADIDEVVKSRAGVFRQCYQRVLDHRPGIGGKLVVHFRIGSDGLVIPGETSFAPGSTLDEAEVKSCVVANINRLKFPAKGVANVNYPLLFVQGH